MVDIAICGIISFLTLVYALHDCVSLNLNVVRGSVSR